MSIQADKQDKAPDEGYDMEYSFAGFEVLQNDQLASASISATPAGLTIGAVTVGPPSDSPDGKKTSVFSRISGGAIGTIYRLKILGTTEAGQQPEGFVDLDCSEP